MKRYEKMTKEEIIQLYTDFDCGDCNFCPLYDSEKAKHNCGENNDMSCSEEIKNWLNQEIEMIPRAWTFKTSTEMLAAWELYITNLSRQHHGVEFYDWLYENVEK